MKLLDATCPRSGGPCRHCSIERVLRPCTEILKDARTGLFRAGKRVLRMAELGPFCNNDGRHFVQDLAICPVPAAIAVPLVPVEVSPLEWAARRGI
jgi:hypothetical protein